MTPRSSDTDACPGALRLHAAADGMLARVRLPGGMLSGTQLRSLRELAEEFGDGCLELTSRANLQLRALKPDDAPALAARLRSAGLLPSSTHDNVRNIAAPPLPGSPLRALVGRLDLAIQADAGLAVLPGKFLFAIGRVALAADVAAVPTVPAPPHSTTGPAGPGAVPSPATPDAVPGLRVATPPAVPGPATPHTVPGLQAAMPPAVPGPGGLGAVPRPRAGVVDGGLFTVWLGGHDTGLRAGFDDVVPMLIAAAHAFLAERESQRGGGAAAWRLRELDDGPARVSARVAVALGVTPVPTAADVAAPTDAAAPGATAESGDLIGVVRQEDGLAAVAALVPLGRLGGVPLRVLEDTGLLVVTPSRGVVVADLAPEAAEAWADRLAGAGLAVTPGSPWSGVTACAGRPGCAKSLADVRADATAASRFVDGLPVHWVGCARACGSPAGPHVRAEATTGGYLITRRPESGSGLVGPSTAAPETPRIGDSGPIAARNGNAATVTTGTGTPGTVTARSNDPGSVTTGSSLGTATARRSPGTVMARSSDPATVTARSGSGPAAARSSDAGMVTVSSGRVGMVAASSGDAGTVAAGSGGSGTVAASGGGSGTVAASGLEDAIAVARRP